jgi:adenine-specific DNA-methyltransferase
MSPQSVEAERLSQQSILDGERSAAERNELGQFATPPQLAEEVVRAAISHLEPGTLIHFLDPSIGSGSFFSALLRVARQERIASAAGIEIDGRFVEAGRNLWDRFGLQITHGDFTSVPAPAEEARPNLLVANPPYVRHHHLGGTDKVRLKHLVKQQLGLDVSGLAGLYVYFLLLSYEWMAEDGVAAWLIPSEWMDVNYGRVIKRFLTERVSPIRIHLFEASDVRFDDALVSSSVVFFRKTKPSRETSLRITAGPHLDQPRLDTLLNLRDLSATSKWSHVLREGVAPVAEGLRGPTIGDLFKIRRGIATGMNEFFIRGRDEFLQMGIPEQFLRPVLPSSRHLPDAIIQARPDGYPDLMAELALLDCKVPESEVAETFPALFAYLTSELANEARSAYLARGRKPWYSQETREPALYLSTYMGRGRGGGSPFRFFLNRSRAIATNVFLMLYPAAELADRLRGDTAAQETVLRLLTEIAAASFSSHGRVYGGGLHKLEPKELASLPAGEILEALGLREGSDLQFGLGLG